MEFYKTFKNLSFATMIASMLYVCDSCNYLQTKKAEARYPIERTTKTSEKTLEIILKK